MLNYKYIAVLSTSIWNFRTMADRKGWLNKTRYFKYIKGNPVITGYY